MGSAKIEVIKASGAIHVSHRITLVQQQLWNILLAYSFYNFDKHDEYEITLKELSEHIPYSLFKLDKIKEDLRTLGRTQVEYNILNKDKQSCGRHYVRDLNNHICE